MKKALSLFLAIIMIFGVAAVGITELPHTHAEASQNTYLENNFMYEVVDGNAVIIDYVDKESTDEIFIPDTLGGYPVTELAAESFKGCQCIAITISASVISIDYEAFAYDMPNIERYTVDADNPVYSSDEIGILYSVRASGIYKALYAYPQNAPAESLDLTVVEIAPFAFTEVSNLKSISLTSYSGRWPYAINNYAFYNATSIESVVLGGRIYAIGDHAFGSCPSLASVSISDVVDKMGFEIFEDTPFTDNLENFDEDGVLYLGKNLVATHPDADKEYYEIKAGTYAVAGGAFEWESLKEIYICKSLDGVYAYSNPYAKCPNLETFICESGGDFSTDNYGVLCGSGVTIAYPNGRYQSCYILHPNRTEIISYAFYLSPVKNIYIPSYVYSIGYMGLGGEGVTDIHYGGDESKWESSRHPKQSFDKLTAAEDVAEIHFNDYSTDDYSNNAHRVIESSATHSVCMCGYTAEFTPAKDGCTEDGFVYTLKNGEATVTDYLFEDSTAVLVIPESVDGYPVTKIGRSAFTDCMFTSVHIPASVKEIDPEAFAYTGNNFEEITVAPGNGYFIVKDGALLSYNMDILYLYPQNAPATSYTIPVTVKVIYYYAFSGTLNLKEVVFFDNVVMIGDNAFYQSSIEKITCQNDLFYLGNEVFKDSQLKEISLTATPFYFGYNVFEGTPFLENAVYDEDGVFYHDKILVATKEEAGKSYYEVKDGTTAIAGGAFNWSDLEEVYIPATVIAINGSSFTNATSLKTFNVDSENQYFCVDDYGVLYNKDKSTLVAYPVAHENICYGIPRGVTEIGAYAFNNVQLTRCINIPIDVKTVYEFAFGIVGFKRILRIEYEGTHIDWNKIEFLQTYSNRVSSETFISKKFSEYYEGEHTNVEIETRNADCDDQGYISYECSCGFICYIYSDPLGHTPEEEYTVVNEATCTSQGENSLYCAVCKKTLDTVYPPALGHDKEFIKYINPTCEEVGGSLYKCNRCEIEIFEEEEAALGHVNSGETVEIAPTCTEDGGKYYLCERCAEPIYDECIETYPATGHTEGEWKRTQEPTCRRKQIDTLYCAVCKEAIETKTGDYGTHDYRTSVITQTCTFKTTYYCCVGGCGDSYYEDIVSSSDAILGENSLGIGHIVEEVITEPTCTEKGKSYKRCTVCGATVGDVTETETYGHTWSEAVTQDATCSQEGIRTLTCTLCGATEEETIPKIAHTFGNWEYESGNTFSGNCFVCGEKFDSIEVDIAFEQNEVSLYNQTSTILSVTVTENISDDIIFNSSDTDIVTVYSDGKVTAKAPGKAVITARISGTEIMTQCEVTVTARSFGVEWIINGEIFEYNYVEEGAPIEVPEAPEKAGLVFTGWTPEIPDAMPSESLTFTAVYNIVSQSAGFDVSATYSPDAFDEPVSLDVKEVEGEREPGGVYMVDGQSYNQVGLYNIKAVNENSEVVQPNEGHKVTLRLAIPEAYKNRTSFVIYHRFVDGTREQLSTAKGTLKVENGYLVFEVSSFSEFEVLVFDSSIRITNLPVKTVYAYGEELDLTGISVIYTNADGTKKAITKTEHLSVSGYDSSKVGIQTVTVRYGNRTDTFEVTVKYTFWQWIIRIFTFGLFKF